MCSISSRFSMMLSSILVFASRCSRVESWCRGDPNNQGWGAIAKKHRLRSYQAFIHQLRSCKLLNSGSSSPPAPLRVFCSIWRFFTNFGIANAFMYFHLTNKIFSSIRFWEIFEDYRFLYFSHFEFKFVTKISEKSVGLGLVGSGLRLKYSKLTSEKYKSNVPAVPNSF